MDRLIGAILIQVVKDWRQNRDRQAILEFLGSEWFVELSCFLDLDPGTIRTKLETGDLKATNIRAAYRQRLNCN